MEIKEYAAFIDDTIDGGPFSSFLPSLLIEREKEVCVDVIGSVPEEGFSKLRTIVLQWAESVTGKGRDFLTAYKEDEAHFRVIRRQKGMFSEAEFPAKKA